MTNRSFSLLTPVLGLLSVSLVGLAVGCGSDSEEDVVTTADAAVAKDSASGGDDTTTEDSGVVTDSGVTSDAASSDAAAADGSTSPGPFNVNPNGAVFAAVHAGTSWFLGGDFTAVNAIPASRFLALDTSGNVSSTCMTDSGFNGVVNAVLRVGTSLYVGGSFLTYKGQPANRLVKLDASTCALDTTFSPPANNGFNDTVTALGTSGTSLYVGGGFSAYRNVANSANRIAKLDLTTGAQDLTFSPVGATSNGFDGPVNAFAFAGTSIYVGGAFTSYKGVVFSASNVAKLDLASGAIDTTFSPVGFNANGTNAAVGTLAVSGTSLYLGGGFTTYKGVANSAIRLAKLDLTSGALDTTFSPPGANGFNNYVYALVPSGNSLYVGGAFTDYRGVANSARGIAKIDLGSGAVDTTFTPSGAAAASGFEGAVTSLAVQGASVYAGGVFRNFKGVRVNRLAKLNATTGALDGFAPTGKTERGVEAAVNVVATDGTTVWVGGGFKSYSGASANHIAKLDDTTYALDTTFSPAASNGFDDQVLALAASGTSIYVGGDFTDYRGGALSAVKIAKLDMATGALDTTFSPPANNGFNDYVSAFAVSGSSLYVGGSFTAYRGTINSAYRLAKLDLTSGALDTTFSPPGAGSNGFDSRVAALLANGTSLYVGGAFTSYKGVASSARRIAKLDLTTGALDTAFSPPGASANGFDEGVVSLASSGTSLYAAGYFSSYKGVAASANGLAKLDLTSGAIDTTFSPVGANANGFNNSVITVAVDGDAVFVGGDFTGYKGVANSANHLAKLNATTGVLDTTFSPLGAAANGFGSGASVHVVTPHAGSVVVGGDAQMTYRGTSVLGAVKVDQTTGVLQ